MVKKLGKQVSRKYQNQNEVFNISEPSFDLKFDVYDWDRVGSHDYHGRVVINRMDIPIYGHTMWHLNWKQIHR